MSTETPPKERSVPKPVFTDAEAGSQEFPSSTSRSFNYFTPAKRRASRYPYALGGRSARMGGAILIDCIL